MEKFGFWSKQAHVRTNMSLCMRTWAPCVHPSPNWTTDVGENIDESKTLKKTACLCKLRMFPFLPKKKSRTNTNLHRFCLSHSEHPFQSIGQGHPNGLCKVPKVLSCENNLCLWSDFNRTIQGNQVHGLASRKFERRVGDTSCRPPPRPGRTTAGPPKKQSPTPTLGPHFHHSPATHMHHTHHHAAPEGHTCGAWAGTRIRGRVILSSDEQSPKRSLKTCL